MPRFIVVLTDLSTKEVQHHITRIETPADAICNHPWFTTIYRAEWVAANIYSPDEEEVKGNIMECLNWSCLCANLDEEIMKDLNGGDSSVSSVTQLN